MTPSISDPDRTLTLHANRTDYRVAAFAALAITIHVVEAQLPSPLPGVKPGLANVVTIAVLVRYGWAAAAWVTALRVLVASLVIGTFLSPTFMLSASGAVASVLALGALSALPGVGPLGYSVVAALAHMAAQFLVAWLWLVPHPALVSLLPPFMALAFVTGLVSGTIALALLRRLEAWQPGPNDDSTPGSPPT